jgi:hypothetical protein
MDPNTESFYGKFIFSVNVNMMPRVSSCAREYLLQE